jgi:hypothetical protein
MLRNIPVVRRCRLHRCGSLKSLQKKVCNEYSIWIFNHRAQQPLSLRRRSTTSRLLGLRVPIPPEAWIFVYGECWALSGRGLCDEVITLPEEFCRCGGTLCVIYKRQERGGHGPRWAAEQLGEKYSFPFSQLTLSQLQNSKR